MGSFGFGTVQNLNYDNIFMNTSRHGDRTYLRTHTHIRMNTRKIRKSEYKWIISKLKSVCDIIVLQNVIIGEIGQSVQGIFVLFFKTACGSTIS